MLLYSSKNASQLDIAISSTALCIGTMRTFQNIQKSCRTKKSSVCLLAISKFNRKTIKAYSLLLTLQCFGPDGRELMKWKSGTIAAYEARLLLVDMLQPLLLRVNANETNFLDLLLTMPNRNSQPFLYYM